MKNNIILVLFILFSLATTYFLACVFSLIMAWIAVNAFGTQWPNIWLSGLFAWVLTGSIVMLKNYLK